MDTLDLKLRTIIAITTTHIVLPRDWFVVSSKDKGGVIKIVDEVVKQKKWIEEYLNSFDFEMVVKKDKIIIFRHSMRNQFKKKTLNI